VAIDLDTIKSAPLESGASWDDASRWSCAVIYGLVDDVLATAGAKVVVDTPSYSSNVRPTNRSVRSVFNTGQRSAVKCVV
jgi:hypothetical protein